jgi:FdhE protein
MLSRFIDSCEDSIDFMIPYIEKGIPKIKLELTPLKAAMERGHLNLRDCMKAPLKGQEKKIDEIVLNLETQPLVLKLILDQLMKPFLEKRIEGIQSLIQNLTWPKGYCPLYGSFPKESPGLAADPLPSGREGPFRSGHGRAVAEDLQHR